MPIAVVTRFRARSVRFLLPFAWYARKLLNQGHSMLQSTPLLRRLAGTPVLLFPGLLLLSFALSGCSSIGLLTINSLARFGDYSLSQNISYAAPKTDRLDVYTPTGKHLGKQRPTLIFFYGGCWGHCNPYDKSDYRFVGQALAAQGYNVVIPDYRQYPQVHFQAMLQDLTDAVNWTHQHIADYGGGPDNLFLIGHSSGAHLAATLNFDSQLLPAASAKAIRGFIGLAGPYDFKLKKPYERDLFGPPKRFPESQPINFVTGNAPPALLLQGGADHTVSPSNMKRLAQHIRAKGGDVTTHLYPDKDHVGLIAALSIPLRDESGVFPDIVRFIQSHQQPPVPADGTGSTKKNRLKASAECRLSQC